MPPPPVKTAGSDAKLQILGVMTAIVYLGIAFGTNRTRDVRLAEDCADFAKMLYDAANSRLS